MHDLATNSAAPRAGSRLLGWTLLTAALVVGLPAPVLAFNCASNASGNWNVAATWTGCNNTTPQSTDTAQIRSGNTVTMNTTATVTSLTIGSSAGNNTSTLSFNAGAQLTVNGTVTLSGTNGNRGGTTDMTSGGTLIAQGFAAGSGTVTWTPGTGTVQLTATNTLPTVVNTFNNLTITGGTTTLGAATTVSGSLAINGGGLTDGGFQLTGNATGTMTMASGTNLNLGSGANNTAFPTAFTTANITLNSASTVTYQSTGAQTVSGVPTYGNLTINKSGATGTLGAATTVAGALTMSAGTLNTSAASSFALSVTGGITGAGTLTINNSAVSVGGDMTVTTFNAGAATSNVTFNGTGAQQVGGTYTFRTLTINKASGTATLGGATTVNSLAITAGTLADGGFQITGNAAGNMTMASGTLLTLGTASNTVFPMNFTGGNITLNAASTVTYQSTGAQTVSGTPTYGNLTINKSGTTGTLGGGTTVAGALTISAGTLDTSAASNFALSVTGGITGVGALTANASAVSVGGNMTVTTFTAGTSTVTFNGAAAQAVGGAYTFNNLAVNKSTGTATLGGSTAVGGNLTLTAGTLSTSASNFNLSVTGNITGTGTLAGNGSAIAVGGNMTVTTFTAGTSSVQFNGAGAQTIGGIYSFANLSINKASGTATLGGATSVGGNLTLSAGTLDDGGFQLTGNGSGTLNIASGASLSLGTAGTATAFPGSFTAGNITLNAASTVTYAAGVAQTVSTTPNGYGILTFSGAGTKTTASGTLTVAGNWNVGSTTALNTNNTAVSLTGNLAGSSAITQGSGLISIGGDWTNSGTFAVGSGGVTLTGSGKQITGPAGGLTFNTLTVNGTYTNNNTGTITVNTALSGSGTLTQGTNASLTLKGTAGISGLTATANPNTVTYNGSASQAAVATAYNNLTINNATGITLGGNATVNSTLTLTSGNISAGSNTVIIATGGSVSRTSGHVIGFLQKNVATGATSRTYEVGDAAGYTPVTIAFGNVTAAGNLAIKATAGLHPDITNSGLDPTQSPNKSVSRYWTASNTGVTFDNTGFSATLNYLSGDLDPGLDLTTVGIAKADSCVPPCAWSFPTMSGTATATNAQAGGMLSFSDFGVGRRVDHFVFTAPATATQGTAFSVTITAVDKNGATVTGFTGTATITSTNGNCTISAGGTTGSFTNGVFTGNVTISNACSDTLTATQVGNSGVTGTSAANVTVGAAVSSFNVFETSTAANATTGQIYTKLAGAGPFGLDVVAISGGAQASGFSGNVKVELLANATPGANYAVNNCPNSNSVVQTIASFAVSGGRSTVSLSAIASAYRDVRVRVSYPTSSPTVTSCSADSFSVRPGTAFTITSTNATNTATSGTPTFKTGASFNLTADSLTAGYDGTPTIDQTKIVGTPNAGAIGGSFGAANSVNGIATGSSFTYSEVGNFGLQSNGIRDLTFTGLDSAFGDCTADFSTSLVGGKYGCYIGSNLVADVTGLGFGRFIPDNFDVSLDSPTLAASCGTFSYVGQTFVFGTAPTITVTARNGAALGNATTKNYAGSYMKLLNSTLTPATQATRYSRFDALGGGSTPALGMTSGFPDTTADPAIGAFTNGVGTLTFGTGVAGEGFQFTRSTTTPNAPFNADIALTINVIDSDSVASASNPVTFGAATSGNGISFSGGKAMRFGRLRVLGATGVATLPLNVPIRAEYWTGSGFATNVLDSCTSIARDNVTQDAYKAPLAACDTIVSTTPVTLASGTGNLTLSTPVGGHSGSLNLTPQLGTSFSGQYCTAAGASSNQSNATPANMSYLQGAWTGSNYNQNPSARAAFGVYGSQPRNFIFFRENY